MAVVKFKTPQIIEAIDYHELTYLKDFLMGLGVRPLQDKPDSWLFELPDGIRKNQILSWFEDTDWFINGLYYGILYVKGVDEAEAQKLFDELHASQI